MLRYPRMPAPREVERTGDDSPATSLRWYIWRMSGWHQIVLGLIGIAVSLANLAPVELQRRIIDTAIENRDIDALWQLGMFFGIAIVTHQLLKFAFRIYQSWLSESAILYSRKHLLRIYGETAMCRDEGGDGTAISVVGSEVDKLGGFVGEGPSQAVSDFAILLGSIAYMIAVEPRVALAGLAFLVPQIVLTPFLQNILNRLISQRVRYMRRMSDRIPEVVDDPAAHAEWNVLPRIYRNRMLFFIVKFGMKGLLNLLNAAGPLLVLTYGGWLAIEGETTVGVLVAFLAGFERVASPLRALIAFYRQWEQARVQHDMLAGWMNSAKC